MSVKFAKMMMMRGGGSDGVWSVRSEGVMLLLLWMMMLL